MVDIQPKKITALPQLNLPLTGSELLLTVYPGNAQQGQSYGLTTSNLFKTIGALPNYPFTIDPLTIRVAAFDEQSGLPYNLTLDQLGIINGQVPAGGTTGQVLTKLSDANYDIGWGNLENLISLKIGTTTVISGSNSQILYDNAGVLGEYAISGTGSVAMTNSPSLVTPNASSTVSGTNPFRSINTADAAIVRVLRLEGDRATPTNGDTTIASWFASNDAGTQVESGRLNNIVDNVASAGITSSFSFNVWNSGNLTTPLVINPTAIRPNANDGAALGTATASFSDAFLASGGVINWANGNVTITHATSALTFAGASNGFIFNNFLRETGSATETAGTLNSSAYLEIINTNVAAQYRGPELRFGAEAGVPMFMFKSEQISGPSPYYGQLNLYARDSSGNLNRIARFNHYEMGQLLLGPENPEVAGPYNYGAVNTRSFQNFVGYTDTASTTSGSAACISGYFVGDNNRSTSEHGAWGIYAEGRAGNSGWTVGAEIDVQNTSGLAPRTISPNSIFGVSPGPVAVAVWCQANGSALTDPILDSSACFATVYGDYQGTPKFQKGWVVEKDAIASVSGHMELIATPADTEIVWYDSTDTNIGRLSSDGATLLWQSSGTASFSSPFLAITGASSSSVSAAVFSGALATGASAKPHILIEPTGATPVSWGTTGTFVGVNSASGFTGRFLDFYVNNSRVFTVGSSGEVITGSTSNLTFGGRSRLSSPADSVLLLQNQASNNFSRLSFGGTTSSFPALKRNAAVLETRLADDSAYGQHNMLVMAIVDGVSAPAAVPGMAIVYVDSADGDFKIVFGDGVRKTLATDT